MDIDTRNGNTIWREAKLKKFEQLDDYKVLKTEKLQLI